MQDKFEIIEEGLNNRKGFVDGAESVKYCAKKHLPGILNNIDILVFALGVNDLQFSYNADLKNIESMIDEFFNLLKLQNLNVVVFSPVALTENILNGPFSLMFHKRSVENSSELIKIYEKMVNKYRFIYFDINEFVEVSSIDGLHYEKKAHQIIAWQLEKILLSYY